MKIELPKLNYDYNALEPHISEEQLRIHHEKHHQGYVNGVKSTMEKLQNARKNNQELDMKSTLKILSFNMGGHVLHSLMWGNLTPDGKPKPEGNLLKAIEDQFGSFEQFKKEFTQAAVSVEGSGWAVLSMCKCSKQLLITQIEKHSVNTMPSHKIILALDVWEHAYYLDYKNARAKFIDAFWNIVNWDKVAERFGKDACNC